MLKMPVTVTEDAYIQQSSFLVLYICLIGLAEYLNFEY